MVTPRILLLLLCVTAAIAQDGYAPTNPKPSIIGDDNTTSDLKQGSTEDDNTTTDHKPSSAGDGHALGNATSDPKPGKVNHMDISSDVIKQAKSQPVAFNEGSTPLAPDSFVKEMLDKINKYRLMHAAPPLVISQELSKKARARATVIAGLGKEQLDVNTKYGQAIFSTANPNNIVTKAVHSWYNQMRLYDFHRSIPTSKAMYFTQMVWVEAQEFGAGKAVGAGGRTYVVAFFNPPGNKGPFLNHVRPVTGSGVGKLGPATCTGDYKFFNNSCFKFFPGLRNWNDAVEKCSAEFATLTSIESIAEDNFVKTLLTSAGASAAWLGMSDTIKEGFVTWVDGSAPHFLDWDSYQSTIDGPKCVAINTQNRWRYKRCGTPRGFVCRKRLRDLGIYEVTIRFLEKIWSDALLSPDNPRHLALKHHLEGAILDVYGEFDWFNKFTFDSFRKDELNKILADFKLEFSPDDNSPVDPIKTLRDAIQAGSQEDAFKKSDIARNKRETVSGVLHGLRVELVNATLVLDETACPNYCAATQCAPASCNQQCCGQNGQQYAAGGLGAQTLGQQYGYPSMNGVPLPYYGQTPASIPSPYANAPCAKPPCPPPPSPHQTAACLRPPCPPPPAPYQTAACPRPPCPPHLPYSSGPAPYSTAQCSHPPCPPPTPFSATPLPRLPFPPPAPCPQPPCPPPISVSAATACPQPPCPPPLPISAAASCPQPPCPPPLPIPAASACPQPPCPPPAPFSAAPFPHSPFPPPPPYSSPQCPTPPCSPFPNSQFNPGGSLSGQILGRQLPSAAFPSRRHNPLHRLKNKNKTGDQLSDDDTEESLKTPQKPNQEPPIPDFRDFFLPGAGYAVRVFRPVVEIPRPVQPSYGYGYGYQPQQYAYPQTQQYQPYQSYQSQSYQNYQYNRPYQNYQPYQGYAPRQAQESSSPESRTTPDSETAKGSKADAESKPSKGRHHHRRHRMRFRRPYNPSYYQSPYQPLYNSNPYPFPGQFQMPAAYPYRQQYGAYMNYPAQTPIQRQSQPSAAYTNPFQRNYRRSYRGPIPAPVQASFVGRRGLGRLQRQAPAQACAVPCSNACAPKCTPTCCRDKKKRHTKH